MYATRPYAQMLSVTAMDEATEIEAILPVQMLPGGYVLTPERALLAAMIALAMDDVRRRHCRAPRALAYADDAIRWVRSGDACGGMPFTRCCEELGLDPDAVRDRIEREYRHDERRTQSAGPRGRERVSGRERTAVSAGAVRSAAGAAAGAGGAGAHGLAGAK